MQSAPFHLLPMMAACLLAGPVLAQDTHAGGCLQALAVYGTVDEQVLLEFTGSADLSFRVLADGSDHVLSGYLYPAGEEGGDEAIVLDDCPEGDVTGEELAACTIWQGQVRAVDENNNDRSLPGADQAAAEILVLDGFAQVLGDWRASGGNADPLPLFEQLTLMACQE